jgi:transposase InsO family protein
MKTKLVFDALTMELWQRQPEAGLIVHSDQGDQYTNDEYRRLLTSHGLVV